MILNYMFKSFTNTLNDKNIKVMCALIMYFFYKKKKNKNVSKYNRKSVFNPHKIHSVKHQNNPMYPHTIKNMCL